MIKIFEKGDRFPYYHSLEDGTMNAKFGTAIMVQENDNSVILHRLIEDGSPFIVSDKVYRPIKSIVCSSVYSFEFVTR